MNYEDCVHKGRIKKSSTALEGVKQSLALGDKFLKSAREIMEMMRSLPALCWNS